MGRGNDNDRYVVPSPGGGWDVVKEDHQRASAHAETKREAINRARQIVSNLGGGELRIQNRQGQLIDSDTIKPGHESSRSQVRDRGGSGHRGAEASQVGDQQLARELYERRSDPDEWDNTPTEVKVEPARSEVVSFRLPSDQLNLIEDLADQAGQSISEFLRNAVLAYVRGETMTPVLDVQAGGSGKLQLTMRTRLPGSGHTYYTDPPDWIPDEPLKTVTCLD